MTVQEPKAKKSPKKSATMRSKASKWSLQSNWDWKKEILTSDSGIEKNLHFTFDLSDTEANIPQVFLF